MAIPKIASTVQKDAATPQLNDFNVDVAPGPQKIIDFTAGYHDASADGRAEAAIEFRARIERIDLFFLNYNWGLVADSRDGEIHPDVRRWDCIPGKGHTGFRQVSGRRRLRQRGRPEAFASEFSPNSEPLPIDTSGDHYAFQGQGVLPVHAVIGPSEDHYWTSSGADAKNAWRDQLLRVPVVALLEERFQTRMDKTHGLTPWETWGDNPDVDAVARGEAAPRIIIDQGFEAYDPEHPPSPGLIAWQTIDPAMILRPLAIYQRRLASTPSKTGEAERALSAYKKAELNLGALIDRVGDWRAGRPYEPIEEWLKRRGEVFRQRLGTTYIDMAPPPPPVDIAARRKEVAAQLAAETPELAQLVASLQASLEEQKARSDAMAAKLDEALSGGVKVTAGIGPAEPEQEAEPDDEPQTQAAPESFEGYDLGELVAMNAYEKGKAAAEAGEPADSNPYSRSKERAAFKAGFEGITTD